MHGQAAVRARLARTPLYAYSQLEASRGVQKHSARAAATAAAKPGTLSLFSFDLVDGALLEGASGWLNMTF